jgi:hypothetical protein
MTNPFPSEQPGSTENAVRPINAALQDYSDKDWNYSRITLTTKPLDELKSPYILKIEVLDLKTKQGRTDLKTLSDEVKWGERHASELGMLEVVSLRVNKALLDVTSDEHWQFKRPVVRIAKKETLAGKQDTDVLWYQITEVAGEDFDNR